jgi:hypothetical protein
MENQKSLSPIREQNWRLPMSWWLASSMGFDLTIDRHSIVEGEDWKKRVGVLIAGADKCLYPVPRQHEIRYLCLASRRSRSPLAHLSKNSGVAKPLEGIPAPPRLDCSQLRSLR